MKNLSLFLMFIGLQTVAAAKNVSLKYATLLPDSASVIFSKFNTAIKEGKLWEAAPAANSETAAGLYTLMAQKYPNAKAAKDARTILATALVNFGNIQIDAYLKGFNDFGAIKRKRNEVKDSSDVIREKYEAIYRAMHTPYNNTAKMLIMAGSLSKEDKALSKTLASKIKFLLAMAAFNHEKDAPSDEEALKIAREAHQADTNCVYTTLMLSNLMMLTKPDSAIVYAKKALNLSPNLQWAYYNLGYIYSEKKMYQASVDAYSTAASIRPDFISALTNLAVVYENLNDLDKALEIDKKITTIEPGFVPGFVNTAGVLKEQKKYAEARAYLAKAETEAAKRTFSDQHSVYNNLAALFTTLDMKDSVVWARRKIAEKKEADAEDYMKLSQAFYDIKQTDSAIHYIKKSISASPKEALGYKFLGHLLATQNSLDEALANYKIAMEADPVDWRTAYNISKIYANKNEKDRAQKYLSLSNQLEINHYLKVVSNSDLPREDIAEASNILGQLYADDPAKIDSAIYFYKENLKIAPDNLNGMTNLAFLYLKQGHDQQSLQLLKLAAALYPADNSVYYNLACFYSLQKSEKEAISYMDTALQKGYKNKTHILEDTDLDNIRNTDAFKKLMEKYFN